MRGETFRETRKMVLVRSPPGSILLCSLARSTALEARFSTVSGETEFDTNDDGTQRTMPRTDCGVISADLLSAAP